MRLNSKTLSLFIMAFFVAASANAGPLKRLAKKLEKGLKGQENKKVAVLSLPYHDGAMSSGSSIVQERLTTFLVERGKVEVVERKLLQKVLDEMHFESTGVIDQKTTKELGKILGVGALVTGTLNDLDKKKTEVNARVILAETGRILAAGQAKIKRTWKDSPVKPVKPVEPGDVTGPTTPPDKFAGESLVQIAVLLDTSNSMDGLIDQARTELWKIVNELTLAEKGGGGPTLKVALYEYGNDGLSRDAGYVRQVLPFTSDLDHVSEKLFSLRTNGGQEYCGTVVRDAIKDLKWDSHADVYKAIFIAGNERFTQGPVDFRKSVSDAKRKGVVVNTIYCGRYQRGVAEQWKAGAELASGEYMSIEQEARAVYIKAPQDEEIARLNAELNKTYIAYGARGRAAQMRREAQDKETRKKGGIGSFIQRTLFKASRQYQSSPASSDLVESFKEGKVKAEELKEEELPPEMRDMDTKQREAYLRENLRKRKSVQEKINLLKDTRRKHVAQKEREIAEKGGKKTLGAAMIKAIHGQAKQRGFKFKE